MDSSTIGILKRFSIVFADQEEGDFHFGSKDDKMVIPTMAIRMPMVRASSDLDDLTCEAWMGEGWRSFIKRAAFSRPIPSPSAGHRDPPAR